MSRKFFLLLVVSLSYSEKLLKQNFQLLIDFTCATAKDELEKHPEMRTIAMLELENNFPSEFSAKVLKCLPEEVAKVIINPHNHTMDNITFMLPKQSMVIYVADILYLVRVSSKSFIGYYLPLKRNFPAVHHLSKHLVISSEKSKINKTRSLFKELLNLVQIYEENRKVIAKSFDMTRNLPTFETFESSQRENLSQILFPDKTKNLNGQKIYAVYNDNEDTQKFEGIELPVSKWNYFLEIIAEKLNAIVHYHEVPDENATSFETRQEYMKVLIKENELDIDLNYADEGDDEGLTSYYYYGYCYMAPLPEPYSITELILFLPMDKSCWMWLGITIAVSTLIWRISEGHWDFAFGAFSYFMGQAQLSVRIRTNRLTMKILLQLLIFAIFIFSNGYQSLVTSFMLEPEQRSILKSVDELLESDLKIDDSFEMSLMNRPNYQKAKEENRFVEFDFFGNYNTWPEVMKEQNLATVQRYKMSKFRIEFEGDGKIYRGVYLINEVLSGDPQNLFVRPFHPYIEKFQELMDRSFEAGLHQAWERFYWEKIREIWQRRNKPDDEIEILDFGFIAAVIALLCEIFWKDFVTQFSNEYFKRKWNLWRI